MRNDKSLPEKPLTPTSDKAAVSSLRLLDFDDLFLLKSLLEGATIAATARQLGLTQPAITQRVRKIERAFSEQILQKVGRHVKLTKEGRAICSRAADALALMHEVSSEPTARAMTLGVTTGFAQNLVWLAVAKLHEAAPDTLYHVSLGVQDELMAQLAAGQLQAVLVGQAQVPSTAGASAYGRFEIAEYEYVFVAAPGLAAQVHAPSNLADQLLIEVDRSYALLQRLEIAARAQLRFRDVWFVGAEQLAAQAVAAGQGVSILPAPIVMPLIKAGKLVQILPELDVHSESLNLIYRKDQGSEALVERLVERLRNETLAKTMG